jgi:hypothetical protein
MSRLRRTQFELFADGADLPLFAGTPAAQVAPAPAELEPSRPAVPETLELNFLRETVDNVSG